MPKPCFVKAVIRTQFPNAETASAFVQLVNDIADTLPDCKTTIQTQNFNCENCEEKPYVTNPPPNVLANSK